MEDFKFKLLLGNSKDVLKNIPDNIFHCSVTSPPYWGQRDYKVEGQLGQESTPEEYVKNLVDIMLEVRRVLREDGTLWLNIGDGFCHKEIKKSHIKQGDLIGVPWMVAFSMRKSGWYLRSDIIWKKTNPMPESVNNRPSKSHEHLFLFSKSNKYFYDSEAIAEPQKEISIRRAFSKNNVEKRKDFNDNNYAISGDSQNKTYDTMRKKIENGILPKCNKKDVWEIATACNKSNHFAIYPERLIDPCILAGSSKKGCCPKCKEQWKRIGKENEWKSGCDCKINETKPCVILDPFNGSGTTGIVCKSLGRNYVGIDISKNYINESRINIINNDIFCNESKNLEEII